jgi:hypothetical protein
MKILLVADVHLVEKLEEAHRWDVFNKVVDICHCEHISHVCFMGDTWDKMDRYGAALVNRSVEVLTDLTRQGIKVAVLQGNHDYKKEGVSFWGFLNAFQDIQYITEPSKLVWGDGGSESPLFLPFSSNPKEDWASIPLQDFPLIFIHQTLAGSLVEGGRKIEKEPHALPIFPRGVTIYAGDVHCPQTIGRVTYVGTPHATRFGEDWPGRLLIIDTVNPSAFRAVPLTSVKKEILSISSVAELDAIASKKSLSTGDHIRVRCALSKDNFTEWSEIEMAIRHWADSNELVLASVEGSVEERIDVDGSESQISSENSIEQMSPEDIVRLFAKEENLGEPVILEGLKLIQTVRENAK